MRTFISWSGQRSHRVALALRSWLPLVIQSVEAWVSSEDIEKGEAWLSSIRDSLVKTEGMGIFCLTPENLTAPWLLFEAGAISASDRSRVATFYWQVEAGAIKPPLSLFQGTNSNEQDDVFRLVESINARTSQPLKAEVLRRTFQIFWPELESALQEVGATEIDHAKAAPSTTESLEQILSVVRRLESDGSEVRRVLERLSNQTTARFQRSINGLNLGLLSSAADFEKRLRESSGMSEGALRALERFSKPEVADGMDETSDMTTLRKNGDERNPNE